MSVSYTHLDVYKRQSLCYKCVTKVLALAYNGKVSNLMNSCSGEQRSFDFQI